MSDHDDEVPAPAYAVGYGKPPQDKQWKKGQSGNPRGRRKGSASVARIVQEELARRVSLKGPNGRTRVPYLRAIIRRALVDATSGRSPAAVARGLRLLERYGPTAEEPDYDLSKLTDEELDLLESLLSKMTHDETNDRETR